MGTTRAAKFLLLALCAAALPSCHSKVAVVCDKLDGCGLLKRSYDQCVDIVETAFEDDRINDEQLTKCVDCVSFNFCSALQKGVCGDVSPKGSGAPGKCGEVVRQIREFYGGE